MLANIWLKCNVSKQLLRSWIVTVFLGRVLINMYVINILKYPAALLR